MDYSQQIKKCIDVRLKRKLPTKATETVTTFLKSSLSNTIVKDSQNMSTEEVSQIMRKLD